jgi:hypothetical protein
MPRVYGITNASPYASAPAVGAAGDTYFNTTDKSLYVSDGTVWKATVTTTGVTAGTYGSQYKVAQITLNAEGRVTAVTEITVRARWG